MNKLEQLRKAAHHYITNDNILRALKTLVKECEGRHYETLPNELRNRCIAMELTIRHEYPEALGLSRPSLRDNVD